MAVLPLRPTRPEVGKHFLWQKLSQRETTDRTLKMQLLNRHVIEATLMAFSALYFDLDHDVLPGLRCVVCVQDADHVSFKPQSARLFRIGGVI